MNSILVDPGIIRASSRIQRTLEKLGETTRLSVVNDNPRKNDWGDIASIHKHLRYESLLDTPIFSESEFEAYDDIVRTIYSDYRTMLIAERSIMPYEWRSLSLSIKDIDTIVLNSIHWIINERWECLLFQATPHDLISWVFAKTCELSGISVLMIQTSPIPWRFWIVEGIDTQSVVFPNGECEIDVSTSEVHFLKNWIKQNQNSYDQAIPSYEKVKYSNQSKVSISFIQEFRNGFRRPHLLIASLLKYRLLRSYRNMTSSPVMGETNVVVFLHYQPERTSLPEGLDYSQQWRVITFLRQVLPSDFKIYVKEHPSTFLGRYDFRYRNPQFYRDICSIEGVRLMPIDQSPFSLIDNSSFIVTLTGTVGVQSLIRGKSVLSLGLSSYRDSEHCYSFYDFSNVKETPNWYSMFACTETIKRDTVELLESTLLKTKGITIDDSCDPYSVDTRLTGHEEILWAWLEMKCDD